MVARYTFGTSRLERLRIKLFGRKVYMDRVHVGWYYKGKYYSW